MAYCFPTMDQWHMKSVPLPLLEGLDLRYHPGLRYLKCTICNIFLNPKSAASHTANVHWYYMSTDTRKQVEKDFPNPEWTKPYPQLSPGVPLPPIDDLPIVPGYQCILDGCDYINSNNKSMYSHLSNKHHCQPSDAAFVNVNVTKLLISNPQIWIVVSGEVTTDRLPEVKPFSKFKSYAKEEEVDVKVDVKFESMYGPQEDSKRQSRHVLRDPTPSSSVRASERPPSRSASPQQSSYVRTQSQSVPPVIPKQQLADSEPAKCPSFEEYLAPCVEHPVLNATGQTMLLHPGLGLIKCGLCHLFLLPSQMHGHFKTTHQINISQPLVTRVTETFQDPTWHRPFPDIEVGTGFARIEGMQVITSIQCTFDDCGAIRPSMDSHRTHFTTAHPDEIPSSYRKHTLNIHASRFMYNKERMPIWIPIADDGGDVNGEDHADANSVAESDDISRELYASLDALEDSNHQDPPAKAPSPASAPAPESVPRRRVMAKRSKPLPAPTLKATPPPPPPPPPVKATPIKAGPSSKPTPASKRKTPAQLKRKRSAMDDDPMDSRESRASFVERFS